MVLLRSVATLIGVTARTTAAAQAAGTPKARRTSTYTSPTHATPASACGSNTATPLNPSSRALRACSHRPSGGLSTVTKPPASNDAKEERVPVLEHAPHRRRVVRVAEAFPVERHQVQARAQSQHGCHRACLAPRERWPADQFETVGGPAGKRGTSTTAMFSALWNEDSRWGVYQATPECVARTLGIPCFSWVWTGSSARRAPCSATPGPAIRPGRMACPGSRPPRSLPRARRSGCRGNDHDWRMRSRLLPIGPRERPAVHDRDAHVEQDEVWMYLVRHCERLGTVTGRGDHVTNAVERHLDETANARIIVDHQDPRLRHSHHQLCPTRANRIPSIPACAQNSINLAQDRQHAGAHTRNFVNVLTRSIRPMTSRKTAVNELSRCARTR